MKLTGHDRRQVELLEIQEADSDGSRTVAHDHRCAKVVPPGSRLRIDSQHTVRRVVRVLAGGLVIVAMWVAVGDAGEPLRRAFVPADRTDAWPSGAWERVPHREFVEFERAQATGADESPPPPPLMERVVLRGTLSAPTFLEGTFESHVRRLHPGSAFLDLGAVSPAVRNLQWTDGPAVWGTAPDGSLLLHVDRESDQLTGEWALHGETLFDGEVFELRVFPAVSVRLELTLPEGLALECSRGVVLRPEATGGNVRIWAVELGQDSSCLCRVAPIAEHSASLTPLCEVTAGYSIRPDGCRLQTDFNISIPSGRTAALEFVMPPDVENPEVTTTANVRLPARVESTAGQSRLIVPLPPGAAGRLGTIRVSSDVMLREDEDWVLPEWRLAESITLSGVRRVHVDRPLTLQSFALRGMRQTGINLEESGGTWLFEDLAADARLEVRIGRPTTTISLRALTVLELAPDEARFRTAVELESRGENVYGAELRFPAGWGVIEVAGPPSEPSAVTSWRVAESDGDVRLQIEFRQALTSQSPRQVLITGRGVDADRSVRDIGLFPRLSPEHESRVMLAVRREPTTEPPFTSQGGVRPLTIAEPVAEWSLPAAALGLTIADLQYAWFVGSGEGAGGTVSSAPLSPESSVAPAEAAPGTAVVDSPSAAPFMLDLQLESHLGGRSTEWHRHRAVYVLSGRLPEAPPKIRLPAGVQLDGVAVDGRAQNVVTADETIELLEWPDAARRVEIRYRSRGAADPGWLSRRLEIPLPDWNTVPRELEWRIHLPRTEQLTEVRAPWSTVSPRPESGWTQRMFGPLARQDWRASLNVLSGARWRRLDALDEGATPASSVVKVGMLEPGTTLTIDLADVPNGQRAGWLAVLGACLGASALRLWSARGRAVGWLVAAVLALAAVALPHAQAVLCGGGLVGTLLGVLLPGAWIAPRLVADARLSGVGLRRAGAAVGAGVLLAALWPGWLPAQTPGDAPQSIMPTETTETRATEFDVLIPMRGAVRDEHVWIERRLLPAFDAWRSTRRRDPAWLLQSARYALTADAAPRLRADFNVAVFDVRPQVMLALPFGRLWVPDPDDCRVDGQPAQIRPSATSSALLVAVPGVPAGEETQFRSTRVELELQPSAAARIGAGWEFDVPPVLDARLSRPATVPLSMRSQGVVQADEQGQPVFEMGAVSVVSLRPEAGGADSSPASVRAADAVSLIEVHPLRLRVRTQLTPAAVPGAAATPGARWLRLLLPGQSDVREVAVTGLRSYSVRHPRLDTTLLEMQLDRLPTADTVVSLDFTAPVREPGSRVVIPPLLFLEGGRLLSHRIGLRAAPGVTIEPPRSSDLPGHVREMPFAEMFTAGLATDAAWPIPSHVYEATLPAAIAVDVAEIKPLRFVSLEQSILVGEESLHWQATATIDVAVTPVFRHEFQLAADVRLDSASLVQDGAGRLLDWARHGDRLVLYLPGDRTGRQDVRLSGKMPFDSAAVTPFPVFGLIDAKVNAAELIIQSTRARRLELFAADGSALPSGAPTAVDAVGDAAFIRRFSQQDAALPVAFRLVQEAAPLSIAVVTTIDRRDGEWRTVTELRPDRPLIAGESLSFSVPRDSAERLTPLLPTVLVPAGEVGGKVQLSLLPAAEAEDSVPSFSMALRVPEHGEWTAPRIEIANARVSDEIVVVPAEFPFAPATAAAVAVDPATLPVGARPRGTPAIADGEVAVYRWTATEARFSERLASDGAPDVQYIETAIWNDHAGASAGLATFWVIAREARCEMRLPWPSTVRLKCARWDDRPLNVHPGADQFLTCRVEGVVPGSVHRLQLEWDSAAGTFNSASGELWRPRSTLGRPFREVAAVLPRAGYALIPRVRRTARPDALRQRTEALLDIYAIAHAADQQLLEHEIETTLAALDESSAIDSELVRVRWEQLRVSTPKDANAPDAADHGTASHVMSTAINDTSALLVEPVAGAAAIGVREFHAGLAVAAAGIAVLLAIVLVARFRRTLSWAVARMPFELDALSVCLLGILWWLWLKCGVIGVALIVAGAVLQWRAWRGATVQERPADS